MAAKCPKCEHMLGTVTISGITANQPLGAKWNGLAYSCPHCQTMISVGIDPVALKTDTVEETVQRVLKALGRG